MGVNKIEEDVISEMIGEEAIPILNMLKEGKSISEFKISKVLKKEINEIRHILYKLHGLDLVDFERKKDDDKGWYVYFWLYKPKTMKHISSVHKKTKLTRMVERLEREKNHEFYICTNKCTRLNFDTAFDFGYKCPECGTVLDYEEKNGKVTHLEKEVEKMRRVLKVI